VKSADEAAAEPRRTSKLHKAIEAAAVSAVVVALGAAIVLANSGRSTPKGTAVTVDGSQATAGVAVSLVEMKIDPATITVAPGAHLILRVTNKGTMRHDLHLSSGVQTRMLARGQTAVLDAGIVTKNLTGWCTVAGHRAAGMQMTIGVGRNAANAAKSPSSSAPDRDMSGMGGTGGTGSASSSAADAVSKDLSGAPQPGWAPVDASLPPAGPGTTHDATWHIKNVVGDVAPGVRQLMWTFDGAVPGPVLHGHVGDTFNITVVNDTDMTHNIDFHAESGPPAAVMTAISPGGTHTYSFVATHAGAWLYHCSTEPMLLHIANGMYGALIIDPPDLRPAAAQYVLVGSEMFFGPQNGIGDYAKMLSDEPDTVVFNGYPYAYEHSPLKPKAGTLVRIWIINAGPNRALAFHVVGEPFSSLYVDGHYDLDAANPMQSAHGSAQILHVDPGDGGFVDVTFSQPGTYPFLTHDMADAVRGASGAFAVTP
jgi:nitrite reductase (NO-forming)